MSNHDPGLRILLNVSRRRLRMLIAVVLLVCVVVIVISPFIDLPDSALRARAAAILCQLALFAMAFMFRGLSDTALRPSAAPTPFLPITRPLHEAVCAWLC